MLEKLAPTFLAGVPAIVKPASATAYLTEAALRIMLEANVLPPGALQLIVGSTGDLFDHLTAQDVVSFTGSAETAAKLQSHPVIARESVRFVAEQDSLNASVLGPDATRGYAGIRPVRQGSRARDDGQRRGRSAPPSAAPWCPPRCSMPCRRRCRRASPNCASAIRATRRPGWARWSAVAPAQRCARQDRRDRRRRPHRLRRSRCDRSATPRAPSCRRCCCAATIRGRRAPCMTWKRSARFRR